MAKSRQVLKLTDGGKRYSVLLMDGVTQTPYWVYKHWSGFNSYGYLTEHKKLVYKLQDMASVLYFMSTLSDFQTDIPYWHYDEASSDKA